MLLVRAGALGDVLLLRRTLWSLRRAGREVHVMAPFWAAAALVGPGPAEARGLIDWDSAEVARLVGGGPQPGALRSPFGMAVVFSRDAALQGALAAAFPAVVAHDPNPPGGVHAARWLASALEGLGIDVEEDPPVLAATAAEMDRARSWAARLPPRFLAVHAGSGSAAKNWPADRFAALAGVLDVPRPWLLVAGPADRTASTALRDRPDVVVAEGLDVRALGALLSGAALYVGNDSGVTHLAAAFGAPTLALFGPTDPAQWGPEGPRVACVRAGGGAIDGLSVEEVAKAGARLRSAAP